jgi:hypothetical protein
MPVAGQQLRLIVERLNAEARWAGVVDVAINGGATRVAARGADQAHVEVVTDDCNDAKGIVVQPLPGHTLRLAMWSGHGRANVNGQLAPKLAIVRSGDEIDLDGLDDLRLHVAVYQPSAVMIAGEEIAGRECAACLRKFDSSSKVYRCACGAAFHAETELNCALTLGQCSACERATCDGEEGYIAAPEGFHAY